ncbi:bifunctional uroporphyrinogen-III C-methyltransferase/uroporphyrinogen-III synthase [Lipingzhangella sp. LS1_29]|uniref:uroporphyrinogen-III C-methyltransferase n=1 Tax=Lipingzhangella rawalii TaxID=2055835 RepID=A0ABU2H9D1_9ACTN|nr:bifunctional uroporphyrinogen-III C-methyltransferase/uroporphyrinogen-III synthase [Lipingzhangella rawalii]MDS1271903.1 bifunctional uroporphyrinogen-III C-methyltransferase/uroporphyrinogen-III synthase [Lipingzhangella rawalii]
MSRQTDNDAPRTGTQDGSGHVALVGAGPGDPELLTLRAVALLQRADVVVTVREPGPELAPYRQQLLRHCPEDVEVVDPEECSGDGDEVVLGHAREGRRVVRLYSGDPLLGCHGERLAAACHDAGIEFDIAPGLSSVSAVPTYAGIPLTPEGTPGVRVLDAKRGELSVDALGPAGDPNAETLVVLFPDSGLEYLISTLQSSGRPADTPVALVRMGTTTEQTTVSSTLNRLTADLKSADAKGTAVQTPALLVVGEAARWHERMSWFETRPLFGWRILVPRTKEQAAAFSEQLRGYGAVPEEVPTISVEPPRTPQQIERAVRGLVNGRFQWVAFTSTNAVRAIRERLEDYELDARAFAGVKVAAVGEQTAAALRAFGIQPDLLAPPEAQSTTGLLQVWPPYDAELDPIERVLLPRADIATEALAAGLGELGWEVDDVTAYRTVRAAPPPAPTREAIKGGGFDAVLFTSSSTVRNLVGIAGKPHATTVIGAIGPETAKTAAEYGLRVDVVPEKASVSALAEAVAQYGVQLRAEAIAARKPVLRPSQKRRARRRKTT